MNIKAVLFFIIILLGIILGNGDDSKGQKRKWYAIIIISLLILESSLRSISVGPDTKGYYYDFIEVSYKTWDDILSSFRASYVEGEGKDPGYLIFQKLIQIFTIDFNVFLFICALLFFVPLGVILYRYSTDVLQLVFAFSLYVALFHIIALSGIRQQIAMGFSFMALLQYGKKHYWKAALFIAVGAFIHVSLLIFLLVLVIDFFKKRKKVIHLFSLFTIPVVIASAGVIMLFLASFLANDYYSVYGSSKSNGDAYTYIIMMELLSLFCFIAIKKDTIANNPDVSLMYSMLPLITITAPLISLNGAMIRVGQYFTVYMMLLVPMAVDTLSKLSATRKTLYFALIVALIVLGVGDSNYYFFWQEPQI